MTPEESAALRRPFSASAIGKLPRGGKLLDYVGHAAVTDRLLEVDPAWNWTPLAMAADGTPYYAVLGSDAVMWIRLTVCDVTRLGVGIVKADAFELEKQLISDAIRNAAMRFGVALDLWSKEDLQAVSGLRPFPEEGEASPATRNVIGDVAPEPSPADSGEVAAGDGISPNRLTQARARARALQLEKVSVASARKEAGLPTLTDGIAPGTFDRWLELLDRLEADLEASRAPFEDVV